MDGVSINRLSLVRSAGQTPGVAVAGGAPLVTYQPDALVGGGAPTGGAAALSRATNVLNVLEAVQINANNAQTAGDPARASQLRNFGAILQYATDPALSQVLAQAFSNPAASEGARRLNAALLGNDPLAGGYLIALLSFDLGDRQLLASNFPNNIITTGQAQGAELATQLLKEVATPAQAFQGNRQTCGATTVQGMLADENPTRYIELVSALALYGQAGLPSGKIITRDRNWNLQNDGNRPLTGKLLQPALMADAGGAYDNAADCVKDGRADGKGLTTDEMQRLIQDVTASTTSAVQTLKWNSTSNTWSSAGQPDQLERMAQSIARGESVPVLLTLSADQGYGHYERVKNISGNQVTCLNPWGHEEVMTLDQLRARLITAFYK